MMDLMPTEDDRELRRDLRLLVRFIDVYCTQRHADRTKAPPQLKTHDIRSLYGRDVELCEECTRLLGHALVKRSLCPLEPKPACKHCPQHCYHPKYREAIREVMAFSGRKLVLSGRLDYLFHLLF
ncbi:MAG: nitrous oxide-stimulated promoter family protein [Planctomycetota bacterium]|nr:MAG: nitrous oxide-stimulated promoter family protein [Planctomycetota bacterium]